MVGRAVAQLADSYRLQQPAARGARYARNGSVRSIDIKGGTISARVAGSRPTPYKETITVPQFDKKKVDGFVDKLTQHPLVLASLMQRRLDPQVLQIAGESGLQVFPSSWKDLGMTCSCPDWAVPCKHLAAVIYKVSEEIDNDPFLVFSLHGLDLLSELEKRGLLSHESVRNIDPIPIKEYVSLKPTPFGAGLHPVAQSSRHGTQPNGCDQCHTLRPLVESGRRGSGHRPCLPHRAAPQRAGVPLHHQGDIRGEDKRHDPGQETPCRPHRGHR